MAAWSQRDLESVARLFAGLSHPLRLEILLALEHETLSPSELAQRLHVGLSALAYHVRAMRDDRLLELVSTRAARGSMQSFYRLSDHGRRARRLVIVADEIRAAVEPH